MAEINNTKSNTLLSGTSGDDYIQNGGWWDDNDHVGGSNVTINTGEGNDSVYNHYGDSVTINTGEGNDSVYNHFSDSVTINTGAGNDFVHNSGDKVTITGGKGNDSIYNNWNFQRDTPYYDNDGSNVLFKYSSGDGNDIIYGFKADSTLIQRYQSAAAPIPLKKAAMTSLSLLEKEKFRLSARRTCLM